MVTNHLLTGMILQAGPPDDAFGLYAQELLAPLMPLFKGSVGSVHWDFVDPKTVGCWDGWLVNWPFLTVFFREKRNLSKMFPCFVSLLVDSCDMFL